MLESFISIDIIKVGSRESLPSSDWCHCWAVAFACTQTNLCIMIYSLLGGVGSVFFRLEICN